MKLKLFFFALAIIAGAALWGVNYRLNNPPLSATDQQFRALVAGTDALEFSYHPISRTAWMGFGKKAGTLARFSLNPAQTREFIERIRFSQDVPNVPNRGYWEMTEVIVQSGNKQGDRFILREYKDKIFVQHKKIGGDVALTPRSAKRLKQYLNQIAPQRMQPA